MTALAALHSCELFTGLSGEELQEIAAIAREDAYEEGDLIVAEDELAERLFILAKGRVQVHVRLRSTVEPDGETIIGRFDPVTGVQPEVDLKPVDVHRSTSRRHAVIHGREGSFFVREEVGCANGTFVNGERLETGVEVEIHDGDALQFGLVKTLFRTSS